MFAEKGFLCRLRDLEDFFFVKTDRVVLPVFTFPSKDSRVAKDENSFWTAVFFNDFFSGHSRLNILEIRNLFRVRQGGNFVSGLTFFIKIN